MWKTLSKNPHYLEVYIINDRIFGEVFDAEIGDEFYDYDTGEDWYSKMSGSEARIYTADDECINLGFYHAGYDAKRAVEAIAKLCC